MSKYYEKTEKQLAEEKLLEEFVASNFTYVPDASYNEDYVDYDELITAWDGGQTEWRRLPIYSEDDGNPDTELSFSATKSGYSGDETEIYSVDSVAGTPDAIGDLSSTPVIDVAIIDTVNKVQDRGGRSTNKREKGREYKNKYTNE